MSYIKNIMTIFSIILGLSGLIMLIYEIVTDDTATTEKKDTTKMVNLTVPIVICLTLGLFLMGGTFMLHNYELKHEQDHLPINERRLVNNILDE